MATPVFACGFECGIPTAGQHWAASGQNIATFDTGTVRSGLRSGKTSASIAGTSFFRSTVVLFGPGSANIFVCRVYVYFSTLPSADTPIVQLVSRLAGAYFKQADSKIYATANGTGLGATGVSVTTGIWYRIDVKVNISANPWTADVQVDDAACGQHTNAEAANTYVQFDVGFTSTAVATIYFDDFLLSLTAADYPLGDGYILSYIPNADGTHDIAGANDVERTLTGTDITNATTTAYQLVDDRPMESVSTDFINFKTAALRVEIAYEDSVEAVAPRSVEAIVGYHDASGAGTHNFSVTLRDSGGGTTADIMAAATRNVGATMSWGRAHFTTIPGGGAWTLAAFNALRSRIAVTDASPDVYIDGLMLEAEYAALVLDIGGEHPITEWPMRRRLMVLAH